MYPVKTRETLPGSCFPRCLSGCLPSQRETADLVSDMPFICKDAFYAGLLEHHNVSVSESKELMKQYMKENGLSFKGLYEQIKETMEDDGFFDLTGLTEMVAEMNNSEETEEKKKPKKPQDHKPKSTSTK